jgi:hypothetical protein
MYIPTPSTSPVRSATVRMDVQYQDRENTPSPHPIKALTVETPSSTPINDEAKRSEARHPCQSSIHLVPDHVHIRSCLHSPSSRSWGNTAAIP